jgi:hypothetical protein
LNRRRGRNIRNMEEEEIKKKTTKQIWHDPEQKIQQPILPTQKTIQDGSTKVFSLK